MAESASDAVWVDVLPSLAGFAVKLLAGTKGAGLGLGKQIAEEFSKSTKGVGEDVAKNLQKNVDSAGKAVESSLERLSGATKRQADAAGSLRVAEAKLEEVRGKSSATAAQIAAAEERVAAAQRKVEAASDGVAKAQKGADTAQSQAGDAAKALAVHTEEAEAQQAKLSSTGGKLSGVLGGQLGSFKKVIAVTAGVAASYEGLKKIGEFGAESIKAAGDFQKSTNLLQTAAGETSKNLGTIRTGLLNISTSTGTGVDKLSDGIYTVEKAGYRGADALKVLKAAAQGAAEEGADLGDVTNATTSIMASYHLGAGKSVQVTNAIKTAAGEAKTTMENFSGSLSTVIPIASANKISFAQVAGAIATLTQHGTSADEATQELSNTIRNLAAPNRVAQNEMQQLGLNVQDVSTGLGKRGLSGTIDLLVSSITNKMGPAGKVILDAFNQSKSAAADANTIISKLPPNVAALAKQYEAGKISLSDWRAAMKGLPADQASLAQQFATVANKANGFNSLLRQGDPAAQTFTDALKKATGGATGLNTVLQLSGENSAAYNGRIKAVQKSMDDNAKSVEGWRSTQKLFSTQVAISKADMEKLRIEVGTALLPAVTKAVSTFNDLIKSFANSKTDMAAVKGAATGIGAAFNGSVTSIKAVFAFFRDHQNVSAFALALVTAAAAFKAYQLALAAGTAAVKLFRAAQAALDVVLNANPIALVVVALAALAVGLIYAYKHSETFRAIVQGAFAGVKAAASDVAGFFSGPVVRAFKTTWSAISGGVGAAIRGVITGFDAVKGAVTGAVSAVLGFVSAHWGLLVSILGGPIGAVAVVIIKHFDDIKSGITTAFDAVENAFRSVATVISAIYTGYISPIFQLFAAIVKYVAEIVIHAALLQIETEWRLMSAALSAVYTTIIVPTWNAMKDAANFLWNKVLVPAFDGIKTAWQFFATALKTDYDTVIVPTWNALKDAANFLWNKVLIPAFDGMKAAWRGMVNGIKAAYDDTIVPTWNAMKDAVDFLWNKAIAPAIAGIKLLWHDFTAGLRIEYDTHVAPLWTAFKTAINKDVPDAFGKGVDAIKKAWNDVEDVAKAPVKFVVDTVLNNGLIAGFNKLADFFHTDEMKPINLPKGFASGGVLPGYTPGRDVHDFYSPTAGHLHLSGGEAIMRPEWTRAVGGPAAVERMNRAARAGTDLGGFAGGGVLDKLKRAASGVGNAAKTVVVDTASLIRDPVGGLSKLVNPLIAQVGATPYDREVAAAPKNLLTSAVALTKKAVDAAVDTVTGRTGGGSVTSAQGLDQILSFIKSTDPLPYSENNGIGPGKYDCSGLTGEVWNRMTGHSSFHRDWTTASFGNGSQFGFKPGTGNGRATYIVGINPGTHMAGQYGGLKFEAANTRDGIRVGSAAQSVMNFQKQFWMASGGVTSFLDKFDPKKFRIGGDYSNPLVNGVPLARSGVYDDGGYLQPGITTVFNGTNEPEPVFTKAQWSTLGKVADGKNSDIGGDTINVYADAHPGLASQYAQEVAKQITGSLRRSQASRQIRRSMVQVGR